MPDEYRALIDKVESFTARTAERRRADLSCRAGCDACCRVWLTLSPVEAHAVEEALKALSPEARARVKQRGERELSREAEGATAPRCAMLEEDGTCAIYDGRPLVCRTQGHALKYPSDVLQPDTVRLRLASGEVTFCPLNYKDSQPRGEDVLDAELVDRMLAIVSHRHATARGISSLTRYPMSALASGPSVLVCSELVHENALDRSTSDDHTE